ncbi:VOC family protein [Spectribacter hydrogenoxidans]|uniref:VOC family protein n=1 Tax=Spectribacter hydrogenoxidans TaxID=3075608 RepID=A0ABU3C479_9GAMM|nr:VOC family protein [Salinisphaera sp. W335]MDT0636376.1 VOC family protein [Salinisphaera sp. W335]
MIGYVTLGTNDMPAAAAFYDALLGELGAGRFIETDRLIAWAVAPGQPMLAVCTPWDGKPASTGNGQMVALAAGSEENVRKLHGKALELGAINEGDPGERMQGFYGGYFRDPDGNKLVAFTMG